MKISVFVNLKKKNAARVLEKLLTIGEKYRIQFYLLREMVKKSKFNKLGVSQKQFVKNCQYAIVIGGDGTFISAAHLFIDKNIPLLGINVGNFGFLTEVEKDEIEENIQNIRQKKIKIEKRMILDVTLIRKNKKIDQFKAINEAVINKGRVIKVIKSKAYVDNQYIGTFSGDGVMVSTPTGSTGYSLSAEGPIIYPTMESFIFNTICPHTLVFRPIIIPSKSTVTIENITRFNDLVLAIDGFNSIRLKYGDRILIKRYKGDLKLITSPDRNFFDILREKFKWVE
ncbi:MAG: NAD(+)/NADH kinase [Spirochaetes bacterium]|nr:NAD(+)/NADH kinase [Spirochaetota bacterium]